MEVLTRYQEIFLWLHNMVSENGIDEWGYIMDMVCVVGID